MTGSTSQPDPATSHDDQTGQLTPTAPRRSRARKPAVITTAVVLLVALLGTAFGIGESAAISARHTLSQTHSKLVAARSQLSTTRGILAAARDELITAQEQAQAAQNAAAHANAKAQAKYAAAEAKLAAKTKALDALIGRIQATAISADGVYVVGQDIKAGTWHTAGDHGAGGFACYFATLASTNTSDILDNNNFDGPETVNVSGAHAFEISGPCTWYRTGP